MKPSMYLICIDEDELFDPLILLFNKIIVSITLSGVTFTASFKSNIAYKLLCIKMEPHRTYFLNRVNVKTYGFLSLVAELIETYRRPV